MTCRGFIQLLLKVINFLFALVGLAMIGYGIYMVVTYNTSSSSTSPPPPSPPPPSPPPPSPPPPPPPPTPSPPPPSPPPPPSDESFLKHRSPPAWNVEQEYADGGIGVLQLRRALLQKAPKAELIFSSSFWSSLPTAWFLYVFIIVGVVITLTTCSGYIAAATTNGCCLSCYSFFVGLFIILELALATFILFYQSWQEVIPDDSTGELDSIEDFIEDRVDIFKWVSLGVVIMQAFALLLAVILRALGSNPRKDYDSDDEYLAQRTSRQPLLNRQTTSGASTTVVGSDNRPARTDAWSTRMREKYGLDATEFSYKPSGSKRFPQQTTAVEEKKGWCSIM